jgi:hypothetical protein
MVNVESSGGRARSIAPANGDDFAFPHSGFVIDSSF